MRTAIILFFIISYAACDFSSQKYYNLKANNKMDLLWDKINQNNTPLGFYSTSALAGIFFEDMKTSFDIVGDELPAGRKKLIHTVGRVAKTEFISTKDHPYTGIFEGCSNVLLRASVAKATDPSKNTAEGALANFTPGFGIKFLRDGFPSANLIAMYGVDGQNSWNFFKNDFSNHIPAATGGAVKALALKFSSGTPYVQNIGLKDLALINCKGEIRTKARYPFKLIFRPHKDLKTSHPDNYKIDYMDQLKNVKIGINIYDVYAIDQPNSTEKLIGSIKTTSNFMSSYWGDESLFFRHNLMEIDLAENKKWEKHVPRFSIFGNKGVRVLNEKKGGCPFK